MNRLFLVRHGDVENPRRVRYGCLPGFHLSERGRQQASAAGAYLASLDLHDPLLLCSPLERTVETADALLERLPQGVARRTDPRLVEAGSALDGLPRRFTPSLYLARARSPRHRGLDEPLPQVAARLLDAVRDARSSHPGDLILVSHQLPLRAALVALTRGPHALDGLVPSALLLRLRAPVDPSHASVSALEPHGRRWRLASYWQPSAGLLAPPTALAAVLPGDHPISGSLRLVYPLARLGDRAERPPRRLRRATEEASMIRPIPSALSLVVACLLGSAAFCASATALAVTLPNGTVIPANPGSLSGYLNGSANNDNINEGIDVVADASIEPQTFSPLCEFTGKYIAKGGGANFAIGWYNVDDSRPSSSPPKYVPVDTGANLNTAAPTSDIQILFPFSSSLPPPDKVTLTAASIRANPKYMGGLIGFVLVPNPNGTGNGNATQYHYTEHRFAIQCTACSNPGPWYSTLIYRSKKLADTFYLGFEDLDFINAPGPAGVNGNDLDYEDFLFRFTGVVCKGAGVPCSVASAQGICALGITDCDAQGQLFCKQIVAPGSQTETCDAIDNDCNGQIDDNVTCPADKICHLGACVDPCSDKQSCPTASSCQDDVCVKDACLSVTCDQGQVCTDGTCRSPCDGVLCPPGQVCSADRCVDPCVGVTCKSGQICALGVCISDCSCRTCPEGQVCQADTKKCVEAACGNVPCPSGSYCKAGSCVGLCDGVKCPPDQLCDPTAGACVDCLTDEQCSGAKPVCDLSAHTCRGCASDAECSGSTPACLPSGACGPCSGTASACTGDTPVCDVSTNQCVGCLANSDCSGDKPICAPTHTCRGCVVDADCGGATPACQPDGLCGQCSASNTAACTAPDGVCNTEKGVCVGCTSSAQCSGATPFCDPQTSHCAPCTSDASCGGATPACQPDGTCGACSATNKGACSGACDPASGTCVGCAADADCSPASPVCVLPGHTCAECTPEKKTKCSAQGSGSACLTGGRCGCAVPSDCGPGRLCDTTSGACKDGPKPGADAGPDASPDGGPDAGADAGPHDAGPDASGSGPSPSAADSGDDGGCGCATPGSRSARGAGAALALAALGLASARRRRVASAVRVR